MSQIPPALQKPVAGAVTVDNTGVELCIILNLALAQRDTLGGKVTTLGAGQALKTIHKYFRSDLSKKARDFVRHEHLCPPENGKDGAQCSSDSLMRSFPSHPGQS